MNTLQLTVSTPLSIVVQAADAAYVRAEDDSGCFGILHGHADFLTALAISVLAWRDAAGREHYVAVRGGTLAVRAGGCVEVATAEAVAGDELGPLESEVLARFRRELEEERTARTDAERLRIAAIRQIMRLLRPRQ